MDLSKGSRFWEAYRACWKLMQDFPEFNSNDDMQEYLKRARDVENEFHDFRNYVGACLYHYGRMIENEWKERVNG